MSFAPVVVFVERHVEWQVEASRVLEGSKVEDWFHILAMTMGMEVGIVKAHSTHIWPKEVEETLDKDMTLA